jgi:SAM-dependent methyltransferase
MGDRDTTGTHEAHWNSVYQGRGAPELSWYQPYPSTSVRLIRQLGLPKDAAVVDIGAGTSSLVDVLLADGFSDVSVLEVSGVALDALRARLGLDSPVTFLHHDVLRWQPERRYDLWHDRAVFHFLVKEPDRARYLDSLRRALGPGGLFIVATFAPDGPEHCSGLPVARYSPESLSNLLGGDFEVVEQAREEHVTPAGTVQPFTWLAARRR